MFAIVSLGGVETVAKYRKMFNSPELGLRSEQKPWCQAWALWFAQQC